MRVLVVGLLLFFAVSARATTLAVAVAPHIAAPIEKVTLTWPWVQGDGNAAWSFTVKCGSQSGVSPLVVQIPDPTSRSIPLSSVITEPGQYFCTTSASSVGGESANSQEIDFTVRQLEAP